MHITWEQVHVLKIKRLQNTYVGNPRFKFTCTDESGNKFTATTENNAMFAYAIHSGWEGRNIYATLKHNKKALLSATLNCVALQGRPHNERARN